MTSREVAGVDFDKLFASIDAMDTESFIDFIAEDCTFCFGSSPPVTGRTAIRAAVNDFFSMLTGLRHDLHRTMAGESGIAYEGEVTYTRHDGSKIGVPFCNVFEIEERKINKYRIYIDLAPLFAE